MKFDNPPLPPFRKGGVGGFESYFLCIFVDFFIADYYTPNKTEAIRQ
jgi:hypothetical protein